MKKTERIVIDKVREMLVKKSYSIRKLAMESGIDKANLAKMLKGQRRMNLAHLDAIATALKVLPAYLLI